MGWWGGGGGGDGTVSGSHQPKQIMEGDNDTVRVYQKFFFGQIRKIVPGKIRRRERKKEKQFRRSFTFGTKPSSFYKMNIIVFFYNSFFPISLQKKHSYGIKICFFFLQKKIPMFHLGVKICVSRIVCRKSIKNWEEFHLENGQLCRPVMMMASFGVFHCIVFNRRLS